MRHSVVAMYVHLCVLAEALHLANLVCATGYIFPIDDHILLVKNDGAYYRFQVGHYLHLLHVSCDLVGRGNVLTGVYLCVCWQNNSKSWGVDLHEIWGVGRL